MEWLKEALWAAAPGMRQLKLFIRRPFYKLCRDLMTSERKKYRKYRQEEKSLYHILCQCPALAECRLEIFNFAWL
jgi:hypothetical protein